MNAFFGIAILAAWLLRAVADGNFGQYISLFSVGLQIPTSASSAGSVPTDFSSSSLQPNIGLAPGESPISTGQLLAGGQQASQDSFGGDQDFSGAVDGDISQDFSA